MENEKTDFVQESFGLVANRIDAEKGIIHDALIFGPKQKTGNYWVGASGLYADSFFKELAGAAEGAWSWPYHPDFNKPKLASRNVKDAIGKWQNVRYVMEGGEPKVRGDLKLRPSKKSDYLELVSEGADRLAFSIFGPTIRQRQNGGEPVITGVDQTSRVKFTVDLVEAGGTNDSIFESASAGAQPDSKQPKEEKQMTEQEIQALLDKHTDKVRGEVMESIKPQLDKADKLVAENATLKRKQLVADVLRESKLDEKYVSEDFRAMLLACDENSVGKLVADRKALVASAIDPIRDAGGDGTNKGADKGLSSEQAVEVIGARGLHTVVAEMAGTGFATDGDKDRKFARRWVDTLGRKIANSRDRSPETSRIRQLVAEQYGNIGVRNLFAQFYGKQPMTMADMSVLPIYTDSTPVNVAEAAIDSTGFSALNNTVLASVVIEAQNQATGLVADQLATPYPTNKETENVPGFSEPSDMENVAEGAEKPDATITNKYVTLQKITKRAKKIVLTREAVFYDQTGLLLDRCNRIGINAMLDRESKLIEGLTDHPSSRCYYPSGSVTSLWNSTNTEEANALVDYTDIENAVKRLSRQVDSLSRRLRDNVSTPLEILLPYELWITAQKIFGAEMFETNAGSAANIRFRNTLGATKLYPSQVLDGHNTATWYIAGAGGFRKQFLRKITFPMEVVPVPAAEVDTVIKDLVGGVAVMYAEQIFARENVRVVRNFATALS